MDLGVHIYKGVGVRSAVFCVALPCGAMDSLQFVSVVFPENTHYFFYLIFLNIL